MDLTAFHIICQAFMPDEENLVQVSQSLQEFSLPLQGMAWRGRWQRKNSSIQNHPK